MQGFVDVTNDAQEAGFDCRVMVTDEVWNRCCEWTDDDNDRQCYQEQDARIWDVLFVPAMKLGMCQGLLSPNGLTYQIYCVLRGEGEDADLITLQLLPAVFGGDDQGLIICFPGSLDTALERP